MREALAALNGLVEEGVIERYAIGGAIGAAFYIDALQTEDVNAFLVLPVTSSGLVSLGAVYAALTARGGVIEREYVRFGDWPVQILVDANPLVREGIATAMPSTYHDITCMVFRAEYLCAIALQVGRAKDRLRIAMFLEQDAVRPELLLDLARRYGLSDRLAGLLPGGEWSTHVE